MVVVVSVQVVLLQESVRSSVSVFGVFQRVPATPLVLRMRRNPRKDPFPGSKSVMSSS